MSFHDRPRATKDLDPLIDPRLTTSTARVERCWRLVRMSTSPRRDQDLVDAYNLERNERKMQSLQR